MSKYSTIQLNVQIVDQFLSQTHVINYCRFIAKIYFDEKTSNQQVC